MVSSGSGHLDIVSYLLKKGAIVNKRDNQGATAVYHAVLGQRNLDVLRLIGEWWRSKCTII